MSEQPANEAPFRLLRDVDFGENVIVYSFTNLYGCSIGDNSRVGTFVEIGPGQVLSGLLRRCDRSLRTISVGDPESLRKLQEQVSAA